MVITPSLKTLSGTQTLWQGIQDLEFCVNPHVQSHLLLVPFLLYIYPPIILFFCSNSSYWALACARVCLALEI